MHPGLTLTQNILSRKSSRLREHFRNGLEQNFHDEHSAICGIPDAWTNPTKMEIQSGDLILRNACRRIAWRENLQKPWFVSKWIQRTVPAEFQFNPIPGYGVNMFAHLLIRTNIQDQKKNRTNEFCMFIQSSMPITDRSRFWTISSNCKELGKNWFEIAGCFSQAFLSIHLDPVPNGPNMVNWLVVYLPVWKIWVRQLGLWNFQYMEKSSKSSKPPTINII